MAFVENNWVLFRLPLMDLQVDPASPLWKKGIAL